MANPLKDYENLPDFGNAITALQKDLPGATGQNVSDYTSQLGQHLDQFNSLFSNNVGRAATAGEQNKFITDYVVPNTSRLRNPDITGNGNAIRNEIAQFVGDNFQQQANDTATQKLSDLSGQAGGLADQYLEMGKKSLGSLSDSLRSYQTSLFDKLRPQLNLAAQAGGYQDSGGQTLQEKGALTDLGNQANAILMPYQQSIEQNANAIRYGGASAPYSLASSFAANQPNINAAFGAGGLNFNNTNTMANFDYNRQLQLMNAQRLQSELYQENTAPSFGRTLGQSFATQFGGNLANLGAGGIQGGASGLGSIGQGMNAAPLMGS